jgi:hypothetical protein
MKHSRIAYLSNLDPNDKNSWSGTHYRMLKSLELEFKEVTALGPVKNDLINLLIYITNIFHLIFYGKRFNKYHNKMLSKYYAFKFDKILKKGSYDVIIAPVAATELAFLKTNIPIVYIADTSFGQIKNYYPYFKSLSKKSLITSDEIEKRALNNAKFLVYSSKWAADFVIDYYQISPSKVNIVKFGANLDTIPSINKIKVNKEYILPI